MSEVAIDRCENCLADLIEYEGEFYCECGYIEDGR